MVCGGVLKMVWVKRWIAATALGGMLLAGLTSCVVAPVEPGYGVPPPVVVIRPYRPHRHYHYHPYRYYRPYRPYYGWHHHPYRW
jgi:hypothetical protein